MGPLVRDAAIEIQDAPFYIDDTGGITLAKLVLYDVWRLPTNRTFGPSPFRFR